MAATERSITFAISIHKPWWTHIIFRAALAVVWIGIPFDTDRFSRWLARFFIVSADLVKDDA